MAGARKSKFKPGGVGNERDETSWWGEEASDGEATAYRDAGQHKCA
jgi:hypothetical protein